MPYEYRLRQLTFRDETFIHPGKLTVFVGANNSGKSRILKDIISFTCKEAAWPVVLANVLPALPETMREAAEAYGIAPLVDSNGHRTLRSLSPTLDGQWQQGLGTAQWPEGIVSGQPSPTQFGTYLGPQLTAFLTTSHRLRLVEKGSLAGESRETMLQELYNSDPSIEHTIRAKVKSAFPTTEIALDFTCSPSVEFRVGSDFSQLPEDPRKARPLLSSSERLDDQGDGIRSYTGIVTAMICAKRPVFLIDEPEAFLHPPQAYRIGEFIGSMATTQRQVIVATHSVDVLRGLVAGASDLQVVHLDRTGDVTAYQVLTAEDIRGIYADPLLSGGGILNGLFFKGVVVTEADADSRFFAAVSSKQAPERDLHWVNADNKQTVSKVLVAYAKMGVRAAGIVDIDVLNDAAEFAQQLDALGITGEARTEAIDAREGIEAKIKAMPLRTMLAQFSQDLAEMKANADQAIISEEPDQIAAIRGIRRSAGELREKASAWHAVKKGGRAVLDEVAPDFDKICRHFRTKGMFINPSGELEASLGTDLPWRADKRAWFREAMQRIGQLSASTDAMPWSLIADIHSYLDGQ